jgi:hypothetical protein
VSIIEKWQLTTLELALYCLLFPDSGQFLTQLNTDGDSYLKQGKRIISPNLFNSGIAIAIALTLSSSNLYEEVQSSI